VHQIVGHALHQLPQPPGVVEVEMEIIDKEQKNGTSRLAGGPLKPSDLQQERDSEDCHRPHRALLDGVGLTLAAPHAALY
jgi:hypothetical protein